MKPPIAENQKKCFGNRGSLARDFPREKFASIRPLLGQARRQTKPTAVAIHEEFSAVLHLLRLGGQ